MLHIFICNFSLQFSHAMQFCASDQKCLIQWVWYWVARGNIQQISYIPQTKQHSPFGLMLLRLGNIQLLTIKGTTIKLMPTVYMYGWRDRMHANFRLYYAVWVSFMANFWSRDSNCWHCIISVWKWQFAMPHRTMVEQARVRTTHANLMKIW